MLKHQDFPVRRALISVSDKTNLADFAKRLESWVREDRGVDREYHITPELRQQLRSLGYLN